MRRLIVILVFVVVILGLFRMSLRFGHESPESGQPIPPGIAHAPGATNSNPLPAKIQKSISFDSLPGDVHRFASFVWPDAIDKSGSDAMPPKAALLKAYLGAPLGLQKTRLGDLLAFYPGEDVVNAFEFVAFETTGRLSGLQRETIFAIPRQMALKTADSERAFQFLTRGTEPGFWESKLKWQDADNGPGEKERLLVSGCIDALGRTGRPEAERFLLELKTTPLGERYAGNVLAGLCAYHLIGEMGFTQFHAKVLPPEAFLDMYFRWRNSPAAATHLEWYRSVTMKESK
jgi:hypothetical protein